MAEVVSSDDALAADAGVRPGTNKRRCRRSACQPLTLHALLANDSPRAQGCRSKRRHTHIGAGISPRSGPHATAGSDPIRSPYRRRPPAGRKGPSYSVQRVDLPRLEERGARRQSVLTTAALWLHRSTLHTVASKAVASPSGTLRLAAQVDPETAGQWAVRRPLTRARTKPRRRRTSCSPVGLESCGQPALWRLKLSALNADICLVNPALGMSNASRRRMLKRLPQPR